MSPDQGGVPGRFETMGLFDFFRRQPPIRDADALADFIDRNAAFLAQKGLYEYARARAGHYSKVLFAEQSFQDAVEAARWRAYVLALGLVGELVEGVLRPHAGDNRESQTEILGAMVLALFDRYPVPAALGDSNWSALRSELAHQLQLIALHPPKRAIDIPEQYARAYFDLMPIHEKLRSAEFPTTRSYLRITMANIHDELTKRLDADAVVQSLRLHAVAAN
jgi:hypothetical protein